MECVRLDRQKFVDEINAPGYFPPEMDAVGKINRLADVSVRNVAEKTRLFQQAMDLSSSMLIHRIRDFVFCALCDKLAEFIAQGNDEGIFACKYPQATAETAVFGLSHYFFREQERNHDLKSILFGEYIYTEKEKMRDVMGRLLGMKDPSRLLRFDGNKKKDG